MNTLVPLEYYYTLYINLCLFLVLFTLLHTRVLSIDDKKNLNFINFFGTLMVFFLIFYIGQRPVSNAFGDTVNYASTFNRYSAGGQILGVKDLGWHLFMKLIANVASIHVFFTICAIIYIYPLYKISKFLFEEYWYYAFILFVVSFSFWTYGVNGMRNGAACSLFLWGLCYYKNRKIMALLFFIALLFHKTTFLPIFAFLITFFYNNPKAYFKGWLLCIPLSLVLGGFWISLFSNLGFGGDDRLSGYLSDQNNAFRWDFLIYSSTAVFTGWYFIYKKQFKDILYFQLYNTYVICNGFWILVIRANFSNRFAYLSWFMMAIIIIYPFLKQRFFKNQHFLIGKVMLLYFSFTYLMYYVYYA